MEEYFDILKENGEYTGEIASREDCHTKGFWHKAVASFIINSQDQVLLQKRSEKKKMWPNQWDISAGGHVLAGELGFEAIKREIQEELGIEVDQEEMLFIGFATSKNEKGTILNYHFNEFYIVQKDYDVSVLSLQEDEVAEVKWMDKSEILARIQNNKEGITAKEGCWEYLEKYYEWKNR